MSRRVVCIWALFFSAAVFSFGQASLLRDYVGSISITYHPDVVAYMGKFREVFQKRGYPEAAKSIDNYLKGLRGSGFVFVDEQGNNYVLTNHHVIRQSDTISIAFEKQDGTKTRYENLKVIMADEDKDIALLAFSGKPFTQGLAFNTQPLDDGDDVFAAGFPGITSAAALWQFTRGTVSNIAARLPKEDEGETMGPYIQHTAQIDPGNSGGPLLAAQAGAPSGYAVAGINTLSARGHQAANYAIPLADVRTFLNTALGDGQANGREILDQRITLFMRGLGVNRAVYNHIAPFLTSSCTAQNAEFAISELLDKAPRPVLEDIDRTFIRNPVDGMSAAVAWLIENSMRPKTGAIRISLDSVGPRENGLDGYTVCFQVNDKPMKSDWVQEYGIWRIENFGDAVTGDKSLLSSKENRRQQERNLKTDSGFQISAGLAYVLDMGPAFAAEIKGLFSSTSWGLLLHTAGTGYTLVEGTGGIFIPIRLGGIAFTPYGEIGVGMLFNGDKKKEKGSFYDSDLTLPNLAFSFQAGLQFTTAAVPGLFFQGAYQYNLFIGDDTSQSPNTLLFSVGYTF